MHTTGAFVAICSVASLLIAVVLKVAFKLDWKPAGAIGEAAVFWGVMAVFAALTIIYS